MVNRIPALGPDAWPDDVRGALTGTVGPVAALEGHPGPGPAPAARPLNILAVIAQQPKLLPPFLGWASALALDGVLARRDHELLALRTAANCASPFEWGHHVVYARAAGLHEDEIARIAAGPDAPGWDADDAALLRAADELHRDATISDPTWAVLAARFAPDALIEVLFVVGQYTMLSMVANAAGVELEPGLDPLPDRRPGRGP